MTEKMKHMLKETNSRLQALEQRRRSDMACVQTKEGSSWQWHDASTGGVILGTSPSGPHTVHPRPIEEQDSGDYDREKGLGPGAGRH